MQSRLRISGVLLVFAVSMQTAAAGPQEDVAAAGQKWATVFAENNPDAMLPLYAKDAVLWGTLSPTVRSDPAALKAYFVGAFQALPKATVKFGDDPRLWKHCRQHRLLHVLLHQRRRNQIDSGPLQPHLCEGRQ
jgi:SnoaL-like protein